MRPLVELEFTLVTVLAFVTGVISYWVYRDARDRGMEHAPHWGAAVGLLFLFGAMIGGLVAAAAYVAYRPDVEREPVDYDAELQETTRLAKETAEESRVLARDAADAGRKAGSAATAGATALADSASRKGRVAVEESSADTPGEAAVDAVEDVWDETANRREEEREDDAEQPADNADDAGTADGADDADDADDTDDTDDTDEDSKADPTTDA